jgi:hypothetical protein
MNKSLEPGARNHRELEVGLRRLALSWVPGKKPKWKFSTTLDKPTHDKGTGGINRSLFYRHCSFHLPWKARRNFLIQLFGKMDHLLIHWYIRKRY